MSQLLQDLGPSMGLSTPAQSVTRSSFLRSSTEERKIIFADPLAQAKLDARQYGNMTALESDLKRMVQNAKEFNVTGSKVYEDAERIRKALSNFMPKHNPAYKDQEYRALPTPVPDDNDEEVDGYQSTSPEPDAPTAPTIKLRVNGSTSRKSVGEVKEETNMTGIQKMQQEQMKIVEEMIELRDPGCVARGVCVYLGLAVAYLIQ